MSVLSVPIRGSFEVSPDKVELFKKETKDFNGRQIALERLNKNIVKVMLFGIWKIRKITILFQGIFSVNIKLIDLLGIEKVQ